jgi:uncharacterized membrane protein
MVAKQLIVAVFDSVDVAERAGRDFRSVEEKDNGFRIESGVLVQKDATNKLILLERTRSFWGTVMGALTGDMLDSELVASISAKLTPGSVAFILEAQEAAPFEVDNVVRGYGASVFRKPLA